VEVKKCGYTGVILLLYRTFVGQPEKDDKEDIDEDNIKMDP
jgi:hypothetical protein